MRTRSYWNRPTPHIYSYNREAAAAGYASSVDTRSSRATSVALNSEAASSRTTRAATLAPSQPSPGFYARRLALLNEKSASSALASSTAASAKSATLSSSKTTSVLEKTTTTTEKSNIDHSLLEQKRSLEYGKASKSQALRRAEIHAQNSGKDPRHTLVPRNLDDDICYKVADIHLSPYMGTREINSARAMSHEGRVKVERMEKELSALTSSAMSYKSIYSKSAAQLAREAMEACQSEAASSKKVRKTVVETSNKRVAAA